MFLIYGLKTENRGTRIIPRGRVHESEAGPLLAVVSQTYLHIFWIPFMSIFKSIKIVDHANQKEISIRKSSDELRAIAYDIKQEFPTPYWMYTGLGIFLFFAFGAFLSWIFIKTFIFSG